MLICVGCCCCGLFLVGLMLFVALVVMFRFVVFEVVWCCWFVVCSCCACFRACVVVDCCFFLRFLYSLICCYRVVVGCVCFVLVCFVLLVVCVRVVCCWIRVCCCCCVLFS